MIGNTYNYEIEPKDFTYKGTRLDLIIDLQLHSQARISWTLFSENKKMRLDSGQLVMQGADYDAWGNDDNYVINWICDQLGLTLKK